jgi:serine/threonine protein kinase
MAEAVGLALSAVSLIALFTTAVEGYQLFSAVRKDLPNDVPFLVTKLEVEKHRFSLWGIFMGLSHEAGCEKFLQQSKLTQQLCIAILTEVASIIADSETLSKQYGLVEFEVQNMEDVSELKIADIKSRDHEDVSQSPAVERLKAKVEGKAHKYGFRKRLSWTIKDGQKFGKLAEKLRYLNDSLENCLTRVTVDQLSRALASFLIPTIQDPSTLYQLGQTSAGDETVLATSADLKRVIIETQATETKKPSSGAQAPVVQWDHLGVFENAGSRSMADYAISEQKKVPVLIEWRELGIEVKGDERTLIENRVQALARLLSTPKTTEFCVLNCRGIVHAPVVQPGVVKYGFVFDLPSPDSDPTAFPVTLSHLLNSEKPSVPALGERFDLAKTLASALALFHASKWLHKGFKPENILFFRLDSQPGDSPVSLSSPYIAGFFVARPDLPSELSGPLLRSLDSNDNLHRHPDVRGPVKNARYQKDHDIYSLGVLLYEIGVWRPVEKLHETFLTSKTVVQNFTNTLVQECSELEWRMGKKYKEVVVRCLRGDFGLSHEEKESVDGAKLQRAFWFKVIRELEDCHA